MKQILLFFLILFSISFCNAQEYTDSLSVWKREALLNNLGTSNSSIIHLQPKLTLFDQGLVSGEIDKKWEFGGKAELYINTNLEKLNIWKDFGLVTHLEYNFGKTVNNSNGTLLPVNTALLFPGMSANERFDISSFYFTKKIGLNKMLLLGKISMIDIASGSTFMGGAGTKTFNNIAFVAPPSGIVPPYIFGTLFIIKKEKMTYTLGVYDPVSAVNKSGLENPFSEGVTFFSSAKLAVKIGEKSGSHTIKAVYSTQDGKDSYTLGDFILPDSAQVVSIKKHRYYFDYSFSQYLYQDQANPDQGWGLFGKISVSDSNPNPLSWSALLGIGGTSPIRKRELDKWGVGYYHYALNKGIIHSANNIELSLGAENGIEMFYSYAVTPWFIASFDYQWISPADKRYDSGSFIGFRTHFIL